MLYEKIRKRKTIFCFEFITVVHFNKRFLIQVVFTCVSEAKLHVSIYFNLSKTLSKIVFQAG